MKPQHRTVVCREGWYYLLVLGLLLTGAMVREMNLLLLLAGMLAGPMVFSWPMLVATLRGLEVRRKLPPGVCAGDLLVAQVSLTNTRRRGGSWAVVVEESLQREGAGRREKPIHAAALYPHVPAGSVVEGVYRGRLMRRGRYRFGPLRISTRFPFGFLRRTVSVGGGDVVTVFPRLGRLTRHWIARHREAFAQPQRQSRRRGPEGDFYGIRPWRDGDSRRLIHWRSSARRGELLVRQFEQPRNRNVALLVDLWQPKRPSQRQLENVELAVSFVATMVADLCRKTGGNLLLGLTGRQPQVTAASASPALLDDLMQQLAVVEARATDGLADLLREAAGRIEPGTEIVLIGTRPVDISDTARLGSAVGELGRKAMSGKPYCIDVSGDQLAEYFQSE